MTYEVSDPVAWSQNVLKKNLFPYQKDVMSSTATTIALCCGRQSGKSEILAMLALHQAATVRNSVVLIVSGGEKAANKLLAKITRMAREAGLDASITGDLKDCLAFSNGSTIESGGTSESRIRGETVDLLILDEAGLISQDIWEAAGATTIARSNSRTIYAGTPWGGATHWFRRQWERGMKEPSNELRSWHWKSEASPLLTKAKLDQKRKELTYDKFRREYLAEWTSEEGAYFTSEELAAVTADYEYTTNTSKLTPDHWTHGQLVAGGIDWGFRDANALVCVAALDDEILNWERHHDAPVFYVPHLEAHHELAYQAFVDRILALGVHYLYSHLIAESNGVGQVANQLLITSAPRTTMLGTQRGGYVPLAQHHTNAKNKTTMYSTLKMMVQQRRIILPNHLTLLHQLNALVAKELPGGELKIEVPAPGHDDLADALVFALGYCAVHRSTTRGLHTPREPYHAQQRIHFLPDDTAIPHQPQSRTEPALLGRYGARFADIAQHIRRDIGPQEPMLTGWPKHGA